MGMVSLRIPDAIEERMRALAKEANVSLTAWLLARLNLDSLGEPSSEVVKEAKELPPVRVEPSPVRAVVQVAPSRPSPAVPSRPIKPARTGKYPTGRRCLKCSERKDLPISRIPPCQRCPCYGDWASASTV